MLWSLNAVSVSAVIGTLPLVLHYFGSFPVYFIIPNLLAIPLNTVILYAGMALFLLHPIMPPLALIVAKILFGATWLLNAIIHTTSLLPGHIIQNIQLSSTNTILLYCFGSIIMLGVSMKQARVILFSLFALVCGALLHLMTVVQRQYRPHLFIYHHNKYLIGELYYNQVAYRMTNTPVSNNDSMYLLAPVHKKYNIQRIILLDTVQALHQKNITWYQGSLKSNKDVVILKNNILEYDDGENGSKHYFYNASQHNKEKLPMEVNALLHDMSEEKAFAHTLN
jgi:hypothetical protein